MADLAAVRKAAEEFVALRTNAVPLGIEPATIGQVMANVALTDAARKTDLPTLALALCDEVERLRAALQAVADHDPKKCDHIPEAGCYAWMRETARAALEGK